MSSTEKVPWQKEMDVIKTWAHENQRSLRTDFQAFSASSFTSWQGEGAREYRWESLAALRRQLEDFWQLEPDMQKLALPCAVAAYKLREQFRTKHAEPEVNMESKKNDQVPEFIYAF